MADEDGKHFVVGPEGERITVADLPGAGTHWMPRHKARVVAAVVGGLVSQEWALERYELTVEELDSWKAAFALRGLQGLRVTGIDELRRPARRTGA